MLWIVVCIFQAVLGSKIPIPEQKIIEGTPIDIRKAPWIVSVHQVLYDGSTKFACAGVIIGPNEVLTAAMCVSYLNSYYVRTYQFRAGSSNHSSGGKIHNLDWLRFSPFYVPGDLSHNYAFIRVKEEFDFGRNVQPLNIPFYEPKSGSTVSVQGWGWTTPTDGEASPTLQAMNITVWDKNDCSERFDMDFEMMANYPHVLFCLKNIGEGSGRQVCAGDGGNPVVYEKKLVGIVIGHGRGRKRSTGISCDDPDAFGIYNSAIKIRRWISRLIRHSQNRPVP